MGDKTTITTLVFRTLASARTSAFLLGLTALFILAGSVLRRAQLPGPARSGEWLYFFHQGPGLSADFSNPLFTALYIALLASLIAGVCAMARRRPPARFKAARTISLTQDGPEAETDALAAFKEKLGFRAVERTAGRAVMEKGLPYGYLIWAFYAAIALCLAGAAITFAFAFEQSLTLTGGRPTALNTKAEGALPEANGGLWLVSGPFTAGYTEVPAGRDPDGLVSRLTAFASVERPVYESRAGALYPVDWRLDLSVVQDGAIVKEKTMGPGDPLRFDGLAFYLDGLGQTFKLRVGDNPLALTAHNNEEFAIPGIGPGLGLPVRLSIYKRGTLERANGMVEPIIEGARLRISDNGASGEELGNIAEGGSIFINGVRLTLVNVQEEALLRYRYDPGALLLRLGGLLLLAALALRLLGPWQSATYVIDPSSPVVKLHLDIRSKGLLASSDRLYKKIERIMTANDIRPVPIAGERRR